MVDLSEHSVRLSVEPSAFFTSHYTYYPLRNEISPTEYLPISWCPRHAHPRWAVVSRGWKAGPSSPYAAMQTSIFFLMKKRAITVLQPPQKTESFDRLPLLSGFRDRWIKKQRFRGTDHGPAGGYTSENSTGTLQSHRNKTTRASFFLLLLPPFQNISCFDFFIFIYFAMYLDICYI